jgi:D-alanyl-D-alanine carboxypeptidase
MRGRRIDTRKVGDMIIRSGKVVVVALAVALTACSSAPDRSESPSPVGSTVALPSSTTSTTSAAPFPVATFAAISEDPVTEELAAKYQVALDDLVGSDGFGDGGGMTATVMTAEGTWSGVVGKADGVRDLQVDDQFAIASITKSVVAAQVMSMVEAGELGLDDPVADHLPRNLRFDTNGASIRDLLSHRSGIPDDYDVLSGPLQLDPLRAWKPAEVLEQVPTGRVVAGRSFEYAENNYLLLGLVIEQVRGRPLAEVLREGVLAIDGVERLVYQPDERPSEPMAMPRGQSTAALELGGGYLPSLAAVTAFTASGALASDSPSLARWWRAFCAGEIVSQASLTEMSDFDPDVSIFDGGYGLGLFDPTGGYARAVGHQGELFGYMSWAACLPEDGAVIVVLSNREVYELSVELFFRPLRPFVDVLRSG